MKKGRAGNSKKSSRPAAKTPLSAAKKRIRTVLAKAKKLVLPKNKKTSDSSAKRTALTTKKKISAAKKTTGRGTVRRIILKRTVAVSVNLPNAPAVEAPAQDLPFSYNQTKLELLIRDQEWAFAWWDFSGDTWQWIVNLCKEDPGTRSKLRIHNISHGTVYDLDVPLEGKQWYVNLGFANTEFEAELGLLDSKGRFHRIVQSNRVRTPRNGPSPMIDPKWDPTEFSDLAQISGQTARQFIGSSFFSSQRLRKSS